MSPRFVLGWENVPCVAEVVNRSLKADCTDFTTDTDDDSDLVVDVDPGTLIRIVRHELRNGKATGIDNVYNDILKKAIGTGFYKHLA